MREKEEASWLSGRLSSLEDLFVVGTRAERKQYLLVVDAVLFSQFLELTVRKVGDSDFLINHLFRLKHVSDSVLLFRVIFVCSFRDKLIELRNVPLESIVDLDLIELHHPDVLERIDIAEVLLILLLLFIRRASVTCLLILRKTGNPGKDDIDEFNVQAGSQESGQNLSLDSVWGRFFYYSKPLEEVFWDQEPEEWVKQSEHYHCNARREEGIVGKRLNDVVDFQVVVSLVVYIQHCKGVEQLIVVEQKHEYPDCDEHHYVDRVLL
jgi:hypothetical protein